MDSRLLEYKRLIKLHYLDGRYFNLVFGNYPGLIRQPLIINQSIKDGIYHTYITEDTSFLSKNSNIGVQIARIIIEVDNNNRLISRHSNGLIINHINKEIFRFDPINSNNDRINIILMGELAKHYPGYKYEELDTHPQVNLFDGLCVSYVIKFVYFYLLGRPVVFEGDYDIYQFASVIMQLYGPLPKEGADIEFGPYYHNPAIPILGGAAIGGLAGGLIAGPPGLVGGALAGGAIGALAATPYI